MKKEDYYDWLMLLNEAKKSGLTDEDITTYFKENFKIRIIEKNEIIGEKVFK